MKGKITIINSLALSPLIYVAGVIDTPNKVIKEVDALITQFLWNSKSAKIAKHVIIQTIEDGGLKFPDFKCKVMALKMNWVKRLASTSNSNWKLVFKHYIGYQDLNFYFSCKQKYNVCTALPSFYQQCQYWWFDIHSVQPKTRDMVKCEIMWNNKYITVNKKTIFKKDWYEKGIVRISDIVDKDDQLLSHVEIANKLMSDVIFLIYCS